MSFNPPESYNIASYYLDDQVSGGLADKTAVICGDRRSTYRDIQSLAHKFGNRLRELNVEQENRVLIALPDIPEFPAALFGVLKIGAVVVMANCHLKKDDILYFYNYTRAKVAIVHADHLPAFEEATAEAHHLQQLLVVGGSAGNHAAFDPEQLTRRQRIVTTRQSGSSRGAPLASRRRSSNLTPPSPTPPSSTPRA